MRDTLIFSIPTNWTDTLLAEMSALPVDEIYGALPSTPVGSGRAAGILPDVDRPHARSHIRAARESGFDFNYLLNGACLGNRECLPGFRAALFDHVSWAVDCGVTSVTVANLFVLEFVKHHFPALRVRTSIFFMPGNLPTLKRLVDSGADAITLTQADNRDFRYLEQVRKSVDADIWLLANVACAYDCPALVYHANSAGHDSQADLETPCGPNTYPILSCTRNKLSSGMGLLRARWIRPEDLSVYESFGFNRFKLAGRDADTGWMATAAAAYANRRYEGNLTDILDGFHYLAAWRRRAGNIPFRMPYVDNRKLGGFIDHFVGGRCTDSCDRCGYCETRAADAVTLHRAENQAFLAVVEAYAETKRMV